MSAKNRDRADNRFLEPSRSAADGGQKVGKTPGKIPISVLRDLGHPESPIKAIRANCVECAGGKGEVRKCHLTHCPLWPFRMGVNPFYGR